MIKLKLNNKIYNFNNWRLYKDDNDLTPARIISSKHKELSLDITGPPRFQIYQSSRHSITYPKYYYFFSGVIDVVYYSFHNLDVEINGNNIYFDTIKETQIACDKTIKIITKLSAFI
jgi:hypothetical protein